MKYINYGFHDKTISKSYIAFVAMALFAANQLITWLVMIYLGKEFADFCTYDCGWYRGITEHGYQLEPSGHEKGDAANWAFFPVFPLAAKGLNIFGIAGDYSLLLMGKLFFLLSIYFFINFAILYNKTINPIIAGSALAFNPYSLYGNTGYAEPVFLALTLLSLMAIYKGWFIRSGLWGGILTATRPVGIAIGFSYLIVALGAWHKKNHKRWDIVLGLMLIPSGMALFMLYLFSLIGDALAFVHIQVAWNRIPGNPLDYFAGVFDSKKSLYYGAHVVICLLAIGVLCWQRYWHLVAFSVVATAIPLSTGLWEIPRYIWWQAPILLVLCQIMHWRRIWIFILPVMVIGLIIINMDWLTYKMLTG